MTGIETLVVIMKVVVPVATVALSAILKFLWDIKLNSKETQKEFHNFKVEFTSEITSIKNKIDVLDSKTKDSYSKSETDNLFLKLKNEFLEKVVLNGKRKIGD